ncbi:hypothetical protein EVAR_89267_1 [Eumeta japonica]|uniref:Uncharacterized protein n=1 Tax=Eumeta variegata TaxID=151549 RepID=A0A4C1VMQ3_EUMVA|nr:hypothetical protein EVAR_89267_1 [Eumeta japonica]
MCLRDRKFLLSKTHLSSVPADGGVARAWLDGDRAAAVSRAMFELLHRDDLSLNYQRSALNTISRRTINLSAAPYKPTECIVLPFRNNLISRVSL